MNLMVHPTTLTSHADPHHPHSELPPSHFPLPPLSLQQSSRRPLQRFLSSDQTRPISLPLFSFLLLSLSRPRLLLPRHWCRATSRGVQGGKTGSKVFSASSSQPRDRRAATERRRRRGAVPRSATMVELCGATVQQRSSAAQDRAAGWLPPRPGAPLFILFPFYPLKTILPTQSIGITENDFPILTCFL